MKKILLNCLLISLMIPLFGQINTYPYSQNFESFSLCQATCPAVCTLSDGWSNASGDETDWIAFSGPTPTPFTGPDKDHDPGSSQGKYLFIESSEGCSQGTGAFLITPTFDFHSLSQPMLEFWFHMFGEGQGSLHLDADTSNGWMLDVIPPVKGNTSTWKRQLACLSDFSGVSGVRFRLRGITGITDQSDIAIDAFRVAEARNNDVYLKDIYVNGCGQSTQTPVSISFGNLGMQPAVNLTASFSLDGGAFSALEFIPGTLAPCGTGGYAFQSTADLSMPGTHVITAVISLFNPVDQNPQNDTLHLEFESIPLVQDFPYEESFEHDPGGWRVTGLNPSWSWGVPSGQKISSAGEGSKAWVTNTTGHYNNNEYSFLESPCLDFSALTVDPILSFLHTFQTEEELDFGWVEYSTDGGQHWDLLGTRANGLEGWYNSRFQDAWTGAVSSWQQAAISLSGLAGKVVRIRFVMYADGSIRDEGMGIDRIRVVNPRDAAIVDILAPGDTCGTVRGTHEEVQIVVRNVGYYALSNLSVSFRLDGSGPFSPNETVSGTLAGGESRVHIFQTRADLSAMGPHHVAAAVLLSSDNDFGNNILVESAGNFPLPVFDLGADTVLCGGEKMSLSPGINGKSYLWSTGAATASLVVTSGGLYFLELTDHHGCQGYDSISVVVLPPLATTQAYLEDVKCYGDSTGTFQLRPQGGTPPYQWSWENGDSTANLSLLPAGIYRYVLSDDQGCRFEDSVQVGQPDSLEIILDAIRNAGCPVDSSGFIFISVNGGTPPYSYLWNNGSVNEDLARIPEGKFTLNLIDQNGCTQRSPQFEISTEDTLPQARFYFVVSGGTVRFWDSSYNAVNYLWSFGDGSVINNRVNPVYTYQENGTYQVQLIATNSCGQDTFVQTVNLNSVGIDPKGPGLPIRLYPNPISAGGLLSLEGEGEMLEEVTLGLYDLNGKLLLSWNWDRLLSGIKEELWLPEYLSQGVYLLSLQSAQGTYRQRLVLR